MFNYNKITIFNYYKSGVLWVIQMYIDGVCPDYSYSFSGKPPPTASLIMKYIEKNMVTSIPDSEKIKLINEKNNGMSTNNNNNNNDNNIEKNLRYDKIERSRLKVEQIELEMYVRKEAIHALRVAMNCKSEKIFGLDNSMSHAENVKRYLKSLNLMHNKVAVTKFPCKYVRYCYAQHNLCQF